MISAKPAIVVTLLALAGGTVAQEPADKQHVGDWLEELRKEAWTKEPTLRLVEFSDWVLPRAWGILIDPGSNNTHRFLALLRSGRIAARNVYTHCYLGYYCAVGTWFHLFSEGDLAVAAYTKVLRVPFSMWGESAIVNLGYVGRYHVPMRLSTRVFTTLLTPTLEKLAEHEDPQVAERAKAALRQVRGR